MKSFSYSELMSGKITRTRVEAWANAGKLSAETLVRIGHVGRFYQCIRKACPDPNFKISDVLTGEELQKFWNNRRRRGYNRPVPACPPECSDATALGRSAVPSSDEEISRQISRQRFFWGATRPSSGRQIKRPRSFPGLLFFAPES